MISLKHAEYKKIYKNENRIKLKIKLLNGK